jgi:[ribosomal protein S5]-alanine N-acetyltransferase
MEKMPFNDHIERASYAEASEPKATMTDTTRRITTAVTTSNWTEGLPVLAGTTFTLRELRREDAPSLLALLTTEEVSRFISPPPTTVQGFERFIQWAQRERAAGNYACFAVVPSGCTTAVGIFQLRALEAGFGSAEWGFALGSPFWGTGIFAEGARLVVDFAVDVMGTHRLEARAAVANGRGNGALRKIGAVQEGILRRSFVRHGVYHDQVLWGILAEDWRLQRLPQQPSRVTN